MPREIFALLERVRGTGFLRCGKLMLDILNLNGPHTATLARTTEHPALSPEACACKPFRSNKQADRLSNQPHVRVAARKAAPGHPSRPMTTSESRVSGRISSSVKCDLTGPFCTGRNVRSCIRKGERHAEEAVERGADCGVGLTDISYHRDRELIALARPVPARQVVDSFGQNFPPPALWSFSTESVKSGQATRPSRSGDEGRRGVLQ